MLNLHEIIAFYFILAFLDSMMFIDTNDLTTTKPAEPCAVRDATIVTGAVIDAPMIASLVVVEDIAIMRSRVIGADMFQNNGDFA